jgi:hypothetical protein
MTQEQRLQVVLETISQKEYIAHSRLLKIVIPMLTEYNEDEIETELNLLTAKLLKFKLIRERVIDDLEDDEAEDSWIGYDDSIYSITTEGKIFLEGGGYNTINTTPDTESSSPSMLANIIIGIATGVLGNIFYALILKIPFQRNTIIFIKSLSVVCTWYSLFSSLLGLCFIK